MGVPLQNRENVLKTVGPGMMQGCCGRRLKRVHNQRVHRDCGG